MIARRTSFSFACAAMAWFAIAAPASACMSVDALDHQILPTIPEHVEHDAVVLKVLLKRKPDWNKPHAGETTVSVLRVIRGVFSSRTLSLDLVPKSSCDVVGVVGRPGYVVLKHYPSGWIVSAYHVVDGRATTRGAILTPL
jgi:hypothetical protein